MTTLADLRAITALLTERTAQDAKWGEQNHDDGTGPHTRVLRVGLNVDLDTGAELAARLTGSCQAAFNNGEGTWRHVILEEVGEALAEDEPDALTTELVQTAAVTVAWMGAIERRSDRRERVYLSGPIAGIPDARDRFSRVAAAVNAEACEVINPFDIAPLSHDGEPCGEGYHPGDDAHGHTSSACYMRTDLLALLACDTILLLPGWQDSRGATVELAVAEACGLDIQFVDEVLPGVLP